MKLLNLLPNDKVFHTHLLGLTHHAETASHALHHLVEALLTHDTALLHQCEAEITKAKQEAKKVYYTINEEVCRTFITPFDREDIQELATCIYLIPKSVDKIANRLHRHELNCYNDDFKRFTTLITRQSAALRDLMHGLTKGMQPTVIHEKAGILYELEDQGDETLGSLLFDVMRSQLDVRELLMRKDLYDMLEAVTDYYRDAAAVGLRIVLKHS